MTFQEMLGMVAAIAGGLATGAGIAGWLVKQKIAEVLAAVKRIPSEQDSERARAALDRIPEQEWFDELKDSVKAVELRLAKLPTVERLETHLKMGHDHATKLSEHSLRLDKVERAASDHEERIRVLERAR